MVPKNRLLFFLCLLLCESFVEGAVWSDKVVVRGWTYLGRFCFDNVDKETSLRIIDGEAEDTEAAMIVLNSTSSASQTLVLINDLVDFEPVLEQHFSGNQLKCDELLNMSNINIAISTRMRFVTWYIAHTMRPRFWYFSIANCALDQFGKQEFVENAPIEFSYNLQLTNPGGRFRRHFSKDEQGLYAMSLFCFVLYLFLLLYVFCATYRWWKDKSRGGLAKSLCFLVLIQWIAFVCILRHNAVFASDGVGLPSLLRFGEAIDAFFSVAFMILLCAVVKGWGIGRTSQLKGSTKIIEVVIFISAFSFYLSVFLWESIVGLQANVYYLYETVPGIFIVVIRLSVMFWFVSSAVKRYRKEYDSSNPKKQRFLKRFTCLSVLWFLVLPTSVIMAVIIPPYLRKKTVQSFVWLSNAIGIIILSQEMSRKVNTMSAMVVPRSNGAPRHEVRSTQFAGIGDIAH